MLMAFASAAASFFLLFLLFLLLATDFAIAACPQQVCNAKAAMLMLACRSQPILIVKPRGPKADRLKRMKQLKL